MNDTEDGARRGRQSSREPTSWHERVLAARVLVTANKKRGVVTPQWVIELANEEIPGLPEEDPYVSRTG